MKKKRKGKVLTQPYETRNPQMPVRSFPVGIYGWARSLPLRVVCFPNETSLKKTKFLFASVYQWERASGLGVGHVSTSFISKVPSGVEPYRSSARCLRLCEFLCAWPSCV